MRGISRPFAQIRQLLPVVKGKEKYKKVKKKTT